MRAIPSIFLALLLVSCGGDEAPVGPDKASLEEAKAELHAFQPWGEAEAALRAELGDPAESGGETWTWIAVEGETCHTLDVQKVGETVGAVTLEAGPCE